MTSGERHCFDLVRHADKDRFLASLFSPEMARPHLLALYAFNAEIARVGERVSEPRLGEIRHQWWREAIEAIFLGQAPGHPVAQELARAIEAGDLPKAALLGMIDARQFDLYDDPMPTTGDLEGYLGETSSTIIQLSALILAGAPALDCADAAGLAGVAHGIAGLLRSLPLHRASGQCYVPKSVLARHGTTPAALIAGRDTIGLEAALEELRNLATARLAQARAAKSRVPAAARPAFLHAGIAELYLARLSKLGIACLTEVAEVPQWRRQIWLLRQAWSGS